MHGRHILIRPRRRLRPVPGWHLLPGRQRLCQALPSADRLYGPQRGMRALLGRELICGRQRDVLALPGWQLVQRGRRMRAVPRPPELAGRGSVLGVPRRSERFLRRAVHRMQTARKPRL